LVLGTSVVVAAACVLWMLVKKYRANSQLKIPVNGLVAYSVSLYLWLLVRHPALLLIIPAFHSLQYMAVVWRHEVNREREIQRDMRAVAFRSRGVKFRLGVFALTAVLLGYLAFWFIPERMGDFFPAYLDVFGVTLFLFLFWVFINVHHYFMDNVMWRKDNPETRRYLFGSK
jgi:hypothetical protein